MWCNRICLTKIGLFLTTPPPKKSFWALRLAVPLPVLPVQMNNDQINQYFPKLIKKMLDMEAGQGKRGRLWASSTEPAGKEKYTFLVDIDYICVISQERSACTTRRPR